MKRCIRCEDLVSTLYSGGLCALCTTETSSGEDKPMNDDFICADCKDESKKHMAKGLCSTCYMRKRNAEKAQVVQQVEAVDEEVKNDTEVASEPVKRVAEKVKSVPLSLTVEFIDEDEPLYHAIIASAKRQRRTVSNEVLFMIDQMTSQPETPKKIVPIAVGGRYF